MTSDDPVSVKSGIIQAGGVLLRTLETVPSLMPTEAASDGGEQPATAAIRLSFRNPANAYCRQYVLRLPAGDGFAGIGCRNPEGSWHVLTHMALGRIPVLAPGPKTSPAAVPIPPEISSIVLQSAGRELTGTDETATLAARWQTPPH